MARLRHFAVCVKDIEKAAEFYANVFDLGDERHGNFERKFKDPDGVIFDISKHGWQGTDGYKK